MHHISHNAAILYFTFISPHNNIHSNFNKFITNTLFNKYIIKLIDIHVGSICNTYDYSERQQCHTLINVHKSKFITAVAQPKVMLIQ